MTSIRIEGIEELQAKLGRVAAIEMLRDPMRRAVTAIESYMKVYPPPPPNSLYIRTRRLGNAWESKIVQKSGGLEGTINNNTEYGPFVQSSLFQSRIHQGRWQTDQDAMARYERPIVADFEDAIQRALR